MHQGAEGPLLAGNVHTVHTVHGASCNVHTGQKEAFCHCHFLDCNYLCSNQRHLNEPPSFSQHRVASATYAMVIRIPPLAHTTLPVVQLAPSLHSMSMVPAISSGIAGRRPWKSLRTTASKRAPSPGC